MLQVEAVGKRFGERVVLSSASLHVLAGECRVILGRNGAGKSTLLSIAAGACQPDYGWVRFAGRDLANAGVSRRAWLGQLYIPERGWLTTTASVDDHWRMLDDTVGSALSHEELRTLLPPPLLAQRPYSLSSGERRRAELALAICRAPTCLLIDEPLRSLAPLDVDQVIGLFQRLMRQGTAIVCTGHEVPALLTVATYVTWCTDGTTYDLGAPAVALEHWRFTREYLGVGA